MGSGSAERDAELKREYSLRFAGAVVLDLGCGWSKFINRIAGGNAVAMVVERG